ncbi:MAG: hypothetical protein QOF74_181 [Caballeronia mineralivorans]|nr:hypothetical protein [Caballeronia mineralivorans]
MGQVATREQADADIEALIVSRQAEDICEKATEQINGVLKHFHVENLVAAGDSRLVDVSIALAEANRAAYLHDAGVANTHDELARLDLHLGALCQRRRDLMSKSPSRANSMELTLVDADLSELREVACTVRVMLERAMQASEHDAAVAIANAELPASCTRSCWSRWPSTLTPQNAPWSEASMRWRRCRRLG